MWACGVRRSCSPGETQGYVRPSRGVPGFTRATAASGVERPAPGYRARIFDGVLSCGEFRFAPSPHATFAWGDKGQALGIAYSVARAKPGAAFARREKAPGFTRATVASRVERPAPGYRVRIFDGVFLCGEFRFAPSPHAPFAWGDKGQALGIAYSVARVKPGAALVRREKAPDFVRAKGRRPWRGTSTSPH